MENVDLHVKYRPKTLDEVIGQKAVVESLQQLFAKELIPHAFLFTGSSGCGKTTLARIVATHLKCDKPIEVDAATNTGVDDMRALTEGIRYRGLSSNGIKFVIVDECHMLSKGAWNSLLKIIEEPPSHVYFAFCTTEESKVPKTIETRCHTYRLKDVKHEDLMDLLDYVCTEEHLELPKGSIDLIAREAQGGPRRALVKLSQVRNCATKDDVARTLESAVESSQVIDLCRMLVGKPNWMQAVKIIKDIQQEEIAPESLRIQIVMYLMSCVLNARSEADSLRFLRTLDCFSKPIYQATGMSDILLCIGDAILNKE